MKKIKFFSLALALGLGLTATYAFKAHTTNQTIGMFAADYSQDAFGNLTIVNPRLDLSNYNCVTQGTDKCEVSYNGAGGVTSGTEVTLAAGTWSFITTPAGELEVK